MFSLPGPYGIGDLGPQAYAWLDFLKKAGIGWWQILPVGPTGYGDSPYQAYSSFAGNANLVSPQLMYEEGLLDKEHLQQKPAFPANRVDYDQVIQWKLGLFQVGLMRLKSNSGLQQEFQEFRAQESGWLDNYALFMALKDQEEGRAWTDWPADLRDRGPEALKAARQKYAGTVALYSFQEFLFYRQWAQLREHMKSLDIGLIGDLPIYVAEDSADVWSARHLFELDQHGKAIRIAGVPPDMFAATGQRWGNPLYRWDVHKAEGFAWWHSRLEGVLRMVDVVRLDHFRGFANYYAIPASEPTAEHGVWELGPGADFFKAMEGKLGGLPLIAEDLGGEATPIVVELREQFHLPGMKVFQFAFDDGMDHVFLPHNYPENCVAYTGTHDNDTVVGWFAKAPEKEREFALSYLHSDGKHFAWDMLYSLWASVAGLVVAPIQDFLELGTEARINMPGTPLGNWQWRMDGAMLTDELAERIKELNEKNQR